MLTKEVKSRKKTHQIWYRIQGPNIIIAENKVIFGGTSESHLSHFLFYVKNVAEGGLISEAKEGALISYLQDNALTFYYDVFTEAEILTEDEKHFDLVSARLRTQFAK